MARYLRTYSPRGFDVAFYFWAGHLWSKKYNCLLDMMDKKDLSMRSHLNGVNLLAFTFKHLPVESQRIYMQYYTSYLQKGVHILFIWKRKIMMSIFQYTITTLQELTAGAAHKPKEHRVNMEIDNEWGKGDRGVDSCLRINSRDRQGSPDFICACHLGEVLMQGIYTRWT